MDDENNDMKLMLDSEKAKLVLANNLLDRMELHLRNLRFQDIPQFYEINIIESLKQHRSVKKWYHIEATEEI